jgi:hypothetical protein
MQGAKDCPRYAGDNDNLEPVRFNLFSPFFSLFQSLKVLSSEMDPAEISYLLKREARRCLIFKGFSQDGGLTHFYENLTL